MEKAELPVCPERAETSQVDLPVPRHGRGRPALRDNGTGWGVRDGERPGAGTVPLTPRPAQRQSATIWATVVALLALAGSNRLSAPIAMTVEFAAAVPGKRLPLMNL